MTEWVSWVVHHCSIPSEPLQSKV